MVRPYGIKVNKRKERQERYDKEEDEEGEQPKFEQKQKAEESVKKAKRESTSKTEDDSEDKEITDEAADDIDGGIRIVLSDNKTEKPGVIFVLERASLEVAKVGKTYQLLNSDEHANFLGKNNRNPADYRPDITHQALLMILDSPINKAGRLKAVYVRTEKGVLFEIKPHVRIPRTYKRFAGIMLQLLQKLSISPSAGRREKLLRVIKNPVTMHLPVNSRKIGFSYSSDKLVNMQKHLATVCNDTDTVFVIGAMSHGKIECDYIEDFVAISGYPLSAAWCIAKICEALSTNWNII